MAGKIALRELSPLHLVLVRAILAALALDLFLLWRGGWEDVGMSFSSSHRRKVARSMVSFSS